MALFMEDILSQYWEEGNQDPEAPAAPGGKRKPLPSLGPHEQGPCLLVVKAEGSSLFCLVPNPKAGFFS